MSVHYRRENVWRLTYTHTRRRKCWFESLVAKRLFPPGGGVCVGCGKKHVDQSDRLLMLSWCVEPLCLSITFKPVFKGSAVSSEIGVCAPVCVRACVFPINKPHGRTSLSHPKFSEDDTKVPGTHVQTHTHSSSLLENQSLVFDSMKQHLSLRLYRPV